MISRVLLYLLMITCMLIRVSSKEVKWTVRDASTKLGQDLPLFCKVDNCTVNEIIKGWRGGPDNKVLMANSGISTNKAKYNTSIDKHGFILTILNLNVKDLNVSYECSCGFDIDKHILYIDLYKVDNLNKSTNGTNYVGIKDADDIFLYIVIPSILVIVLIIVIVVIKRYWLWGRLEDEDVTTSFKQDLDTDYNYLMNNVIGGGKVSNLTTVSNLPASSSKSQASTASFHSGSSLPPVVVNSNQRQNTGSSLPPVVVDSNQRQSSGSSLPPVVVNSNQRQSTGSSLPPVVVNSNQRQSTGSSLPPVVVDSNQRQSSDEDVTTSFKQDLDTYYDYLINNVIGGGKVSNLTTVSNLPASSSKSQASTASFHSGSSLPPVVVNSNQRQSSGSSLPPVVVNSNQRQSSGGGKVSNLTTISNLRASSKSQASTASFHSAVESFAPSTRQEIRNEIGEGKTDR